MAVLLIAELSGADLATDATAKAVTAAKALGRNRGAMIAEFQNGRPPNPT